MLVVPAGQGERPEAAAVLCRLLPAGSGLRRGTTARAAVDVAERFADGAAAEAESAIDSRSRTRAWGQPDAGSGSRGRLGTPCLRLPYAATLGRRGATIRSSPPAEQLGGNDCRSTRASASAADIFGNPFRPVTADPRWLTSTAVALARAIYDERAFDRLPILADALEEAGCDNADVLAHCRGDGPHVRGCWAVDLVLGKE